MSPSSGCTHSWVRQNFIETFDLLMLRITHVSLWANLLIFEEVMQLIINCVWYWQSKFLISQEWAQPEPAYSYFLYTCSLISGKHRFVLLEFSGRLSLCHMIPHFRIKLLYMHVSLPDICVAKKCSGMNWSPTKSCLSNLWRPSVNFLPCNNLHADHHHWWSKLLFLLFIFCECPMYLLVFKDLGPCLL